MNDAGLLIGRKRSRNARSRNWSRCGGQIGKCLVPDCRELPVHALFVCKPRRAPRTACRRSEIAETAIELLNSRPHIVRILVRLARVAI
jgi:hypothetical protein